MAHALFCHTMNRGAIKLKAALKGRGAQQRLTETLEVANGVVSKWLSGHRAPSAGHRLALQELYKIPWRHWDDDVDQSAVSR